MTDGPRVRLRGIHKRFGAATVLQSVDLDVDTGARVALIGPSGSGKSTVLRVIAGLETPDAGTLHIGGRPVFDAAAHAQSPPRPSEVGMVFQHFHLFPHMSALDNVALAPVHVTRVPRAQAEADARALLQRVGLADRLHHKPSQLSGGQKQRVAIARALAMHPQVMLFDEITSALDPETVGEVLSVLHDLAATTDMTMVLVTHQIAFARRFATHVGFVNAGRIEVFGPTASVLDEPAHPRLAEFLRALLV